MVRSLKNGYSVSSRRWHFAPYILLKSMTRGSVAAQVVALRVYEKRGMRGERVSRTHFSVHAQPRFRHVLGEDGWIAHSEQRPFNVRNAKLLYYGDDAHEALERAEARWGLEIQPESDFPEFAEHFR